MCHAMSTLATAMGVRLRVLDPEAPGAVPERLVISGSTGARSDFWGARIQLFLPSRAQDPNANRLNEWVEPGPLPVFGEFERMPAHSELPWEYRGGGRPIGWQSRGDTTLLKLGFDPLAPVFHWLSLQGELEPGRREAASAARGQDSPWTRTGLHAYPWIDRLAQFMETLLDLKGTPELAAPVLPRWKGNSSYALCLSHDVDMLFKWRFRSMLRLLLASPVHLFSGRLRTAIKLWKELTSTLLGGRDPWFLVDELLDLEERFGTTSTLLFLAESHDHQTYRYKLDSMQVRTLLQRVRERGFEIGLHGGWKSFRDHQRLQQEKGELEALCRQQVHVTRQHWLRFDPLESWQDHEDCGLTVDGSLGWNDGPGFRAGTSLPFHPWDAERGAGRELLALPLALMDSQLFDEQNLGEQEAQRETERLLDWIRRSRGMLGINWHPHVLCEQDFPGRGWLLEWLLEQATADRAQLGGMQAIADHWRWREQLLEAPCAS